MKKISLCVAAAMLLAIAPARAEKPPFSLGSNYYCANTPAPEELAEYLHSRKVPAGCQIFQLDTKIFCNHSPSAEERASYLQSGANPHGCHRDRGLKIYDAPQDAAGGSGGDDGTASAPSGTRSPPGGTYLPPPPAPVVNGSGANPGTPAPGTPAPGPVPVQGHVSGNMVDFPVQFNFGTTEVTQESRVYINLVGQMLQRDPSLNLQIEGHTDASGNAKANMMLSWERAFAIFRTLVDQYGIDPSRLRPVGKGATEPLPNAVPTDAENRRVQFRVFG